jgi:DNA invertase Pin-like site-specific DNA recombinase
MATSTSPRAARTAAVGYLRRSTDRQEQSIPDQKKALEHYAREQGLRITRFYTDDAISGTSTVGRRAFQQMIADAQGPQRRFSIIIVYDVKRFGRVDNDEAGYYRHLLRQNGVEVRYVSENFNGDGTDDLLRPVKQWQAREESRDLSKVTIRGLLSRVDAGYWMGGVPPHGYDLRYVNAEGGFLFILRHMPDGSKQQMNEQGKLLRTLARGESLNISQRDRAKLVLGDPKRVQVVRRIFQMYVGQGKGFKAIGATLNEEEVPTPRGPAWSHIYGGKWTDSTIRAILVNPIYTGDMVWNRRTDGRFHKIVNRQATERTPVHGARLVPNNESDWIVVNDAHQALIPRRLFEQARQMREGRPTSATQRGKCPRPTGGWNGQRSRFMLSGLLQCALCGNRYQGYTRVKGKRRKDGTVVRTFSYACGGYITKGASICQLNPIDQEKLEVTIIEALLEFYQPYLGQGGRKKLTVAIRESTGMETKEVDAARKRITVEQESISKTIENLLDNITKANSAFIGQQSQSEAARQQSSDNTPNPHPEGATAHQGKVTAKQLPSVLCSLVFLRVATAAAALTNMQRWRYHQQTRSS